MLKIGFATKYFTLWDVTTSTEYGQGSTGTYSYERTLYTYYQNLSMNEETALSKAKAKGVTDLVVDTELFGRSGKSFEKCAPRVYVKYEDTQFSYGRNVGEYFSKCEDVDYLKWYYDDCGNIKAAERLVELDDFYSIVDDRLVTQNELDIIKGIKKIEAGLKKTGKIEVFVERNLDYDGMLQVDGVTYYFKNKKENWYNGYSYYLPTVNGKAKRVKNKTLELSVKPITVNGWDMWEVIEFNVLKNK